MEPYWMLDHRMFLFTIGSSYVSCYTAYPTVRFLQRVSSSLTSPDIDMILNLLCFFFFANEHAALMSYIALYVLIYLSIIYMTLYIFITNRDML
jgi:hypothetical protein